jgi:deazaflavin-dependent oxidoreductase (nitroreductase family)
VPLLGFPNGERIIIVASNFGQQHYPAWYHNLRATPKAKITLNGQTWDYVAREATGQEREVYWRQAVSIYAGYAAYARRVGKRHVPVMVLTPVSFASDRN